MLTLTRLVVSTANEIDPTKRHIVGRFYDPIGLTTPVIIKFKVFIQELCRANLRQLGKWQSLLDKFKACQPIRIPRCYTYLLSKVELYQLHGFCDASTAAYTAVVYLLMRSGEGTTTRIID